MAVSVTMPQLGESVTEGTVTRWLKAEGETVTADEPLLEVSTDKVDTEIPSPAAGTLARIVVQEDETVEVGVELAVIEDSAGGADAAPAAEPAAVPEPAATEPPVAPEPPAAPTQAPPTPPAAAPPAAAPPTAAPRAITPPAVAPAAPAPVPVAAAPGTSAPGDGADDDGSATYVTPLVRRLAHEHGVELSAVTGTGVGGRVRKQDVLDAAAGGASPAPQAAATPPSAPVAPARRDTDGSPTAPDPVIAQPPPAPGASAPQAPVHASAPVAAAAATQVRGRTEPLSRLRQVIATRMVESLQVSAQLTTVVEADVTKIARLRQRAKAAFEQREGVRLTFLPFFALAAVEALKAHPVVNASVDLAEKTITYHEAEHLGIAVDTARGLLVPVIKHAGDLNLGGLARKIVDLADRTRTNAVTPDELGGGTFTLTNTGSRGALFDTPIINQPQVGILGTGTIVKRPVVVDDPDVGEVIAVRSVVYLALTYDHRVVDGADAARFLVTVKDRLEEGSFEGELGL